MHKSRLTSVRACREVRSLSRLSAETKEKNNDNVVEMKQVFFEGTDAFLELAYYTVWSLTVAETATNFVQGGDLRKWLSQKRSRFEAWPLMLQMLRGLEYTHSLGLIHGDLKPESVFLEEVDTEGRELRVRLGGFDLSWSADPGSDEIQLTTTMDNAGTDDYWAPEVRIHGACAPPLSHHHHHHTHKHTHPQTRMHVLKCSTGQARQVVEKGRHLFSREDLRGHCGCPCRSYRMVPLIGVRPLSDWCCPTFLRLSRLPGATGVCR